MRVWENVIRHKQSVDIMVPFMITVAKSSRTILMKSCRYELCQKIFVTDMFIRTLPKLLTFCSIIFNFEFFLKIILDPDDNFQRNSKTLIG